MASVSLMHEAGHSKPVALGQPREMRWGGRWEWDSGWGNTCASMVDSCQCMAKPPQYCKVSVIQLKLINLKNVSFVINTFIYCLNLLLPSGH